MIPPNPHCMAQSPLPLANTSHTINDTQARRRASGLSEPLPWLFTSLHCWWWISENWQQRITNSFWVLTVSVSLCYITNHPTTLQFNLQFNSWGLAQLSVISLGDDWWLDDLGWPYSSIYLLARATEAMYFFFFSGLPYLGGFIQEQCSRATSVFQVSAIVVPRIISTVGTSHVAGPRVTVEGDYCKFLDPRRLVRIGA